MARPRTFFLRPLIIAGSLYAYSSATTTYLNAAFLETVVPSYAIEILFAAGSLLALCGLIVLPRLLQTLSPRATTLVTATLALGSLAGLVAHGPIWLTALSFILYFGSTPLTMYGIDIMIEAVTPAESTGRIRGVYLTLANAAFMLAPALAGFLADRLGFGSVYTLSATMIALVILLILVRAPQYRHEPGGHQSYGSLVSTWKSFFHVDHLRHVYLANFLLQFFYAWMVIYVPIFLHGTLGVGWNDIGLVFTVALSAFVLLQAPVGWMADRKKIGERRMMIAGFLILGVSTLLFAYHSIPGTALWVVALTLFATRVGAATVEVTTESAFFRSVTAEDAARIGIFRNTYPLAYLIGPIVGSGLLIFIPMKSLFGILGLLCLAGVWHAVKIKN